MPPKIIKRRVVTRRRVVSSSSSSPQSTTSVAVAVPDSLLRLLICLFLWCLFFLWIMFHSILIMHDRYLLPYMQAVNWNKKAADDHRRRRHDEESTYPAFSCRDTDVTAHTIEPMMMLTFSNTNSNDTTKNQQQAVDTILHHGMGFFPNLIPPSDAARLRDFVLDRNQRIRAAENIPVISHKNRWSFGLGATEHESIPVVLSHLANNSFLQDTLEALLGPDPALLELSTITSAPGAREQYWHADLHPDSVRYGRTFTALYSLLIPLQDTTADMGATEVCPGTHRCTEARVCLDHGFAAAVGSTLNDTTTMMNDKNGRIWKAGDGLLYHGHLKHRGGGHVRMDSPHRVALILSFASSRPPLSSTTTTPKSLFFVRSLPVGPVYALRWDMWGHTWNDLKNVRENVSWRKSLGFLSWKTTTTTTTSSHHQRSGWDYVRGVCFRIQHDSFSFGMDDLKALLKYRVTVLGKLPWFLQGRVEAKQNDEDDLTMAPWHLFLWDTVRRLRMFFGILYLFVLWVVLYYYWTESSTSSSSSSSSGRKRSIPPLVWWLFAGHLVATTLVGGVCVVWVRSTHWDVPPVDRPFDSPPPPPPPLEPYVQGLAAPDYQDVLLSRRLDRAELAAQARFLEFHPGTRRWLDAAARVSLLFALDGAWFEALARGVVAEARTSRGHRFLLQNEYGDWREMTEEEVMERTRNLMLLLWLQDDNDKESAGGMASSVRKYYQMGLCRLWHDAVLCRMVAAVVPRVLEREEWATTKRERGSNLCRTMCCVPSRAVMEEFSAARRKRVECKAEESNSRETVLQVGETVEVRRDDTSRVWLAASVVNSHNDGSYDVRFDVGGGRNGVRHPWIRPRVRRETNVLSRNHYLLSRAKVVVG